MPDLLARLAAAHPAELRIAAGTPPTLVAAGTATPLGAALTLEQSRTLCYSILTNDQVQTLERTGAVDVPFGVKKLGRFMAHVMIQNGGVTCLVQAIQADKVP